MSEKSTPGRAGAVSAEEIETTASEKLLALVLAVFIAVGAIWAYERLDHVDPPAGSSSAAAVVSPGDRAALQRSRHAAAELRVAVRRHSAAVRALELRREAYRTALDAGEPAGALEQRYARAQVELATLRVALRGARRAERVAAPEAAVARRRIERSSSAAARHFDEEQRSHDRLVFALRLALLIVLLAGSYRLLSRLRARHSRYLPAAFALIFATAAMALVMTSDYASDYVEFAAVGPLAISLVGIALTLAAFVGLQRYLRRRVPLRRVRRGDCPFCGYPVRSGDHCEGCGRQVVASCAVCQQPRRVGTPRCATCGNA